ncbi:MAG TPA: acyltransferase [Gemmatimonadales bacterium]|nr:acyltransferase [Gemmatimonadales bacterium]
MRRTYLADTCAPDVAVRQSATRIPSLDGLRAVSILFVCLGHVSGTDGFPHTDLPLWILGSLGVRVFFVISGFLITGLLLREWKATGRVSLRRFYLRRTLRIFPPYYAFLSIIALLNLVAYVDLHPGDLLRAASYTTIYAPQETAWPVAHTWSLSVEEQFYLVWPALLLLGGVGRGIWVALAAVAGISVMQWGAHYHAVVPLWPASILLMFQTVGIGCLLALWRDWLWRRRAYRAFLESPLVLLAPVAVAWLSFSGIDANAPNAMAVAGYAAMDVALAVSVDWCVRHPGGIVGRLLNSAPMVTIGLMSYSIYLWQNPFLDRGATAVSSAFPLNLVLTAAAAVLAYYLVEQPALRGRRRIERWLDRRGRTVTAESVVD